MFCLAVVKDQSAVWALCQVSMPGRSVRWVATLVVVAMVAAACTETEADTTTTVVRNSPEAKAMIDAALGGTQAVQDFLIYLDMAVATEDGQVSFYGDLLEHVSDGAGTRVGIADGFWFTPTESVVGQPFDSSGELIPSISVDFGLLEMDPSTFEEAKSALTAILPPGNTELADLVSAANPDEARLLVQVIGADYTRSRTHIGSEDLVGLDLGFLDAVGPGDRVETWYLFGQTYPGDPLSEAGLSGQALLVHRWRQGRVSFLGNEEGFAVVKGISAEFQVGAGADGTGQWVESGLPASTGPEARSSELAEPIARASIDAGRSQLQAVRALPVLAGVPGPAFQFNIPENLIGLSAKVFFVQLVTAVAALDMMMGVFGVDDPEASPSVLLQAFQEKVFSVCMYAARAMAVINSPNFNGDNFGELFDFEDPPGEENDVPSGGGLYDLCPPFPEPDPLTGGTWGDVHLLTFDQLGYEMQAAGEFLVFDNGVATVQMRTEPWPDSDSVSVATAFAVRVGTSAISMHSGGETYIDGVLTSIDRGESIAVGGGALLWTGIGWMVVWPDGTQVRVEISGPQMTLLVSSNDPSPGMLGDGDGFKENDLVTRGGVQMPSHPTLREEWVAHYDVYVESWRITQEESLFYYGPGESTETFTIEGFPARYWEVSDLDSNLRAEAEEACIDGGITREDILNACILDVALTGDQSFVYAAYLVQSSIRRPDEGGVSTLPPGDGDALVVGGRTFEFDIEPRFCQVTDARFQATVRLSDVEERVIDITLLYADAAVTGTGASGLLIDLRRDNYDYAWVRDGHDQVIGSVDTLILTGNTLTVTGTAFLNDPLNPRLSPNVPLPAGSRFQPFALRATCG